MTSGGFPHTEELFIEIWHAAQLMHAAAIADKPLVFQKVSKIAFNVLLKEELENVIEIFSPAIMLAYQL